MYPLSVFTYPAVPVVKNLPKSPENTKECSVLVAVNAPLVALIEQLIPKACKEFIISCIVSVAPNDIVVGVEPSSNRFRSAPSLNPI